MLIAGSYSYYLGHVSMTSIVPDLSSTSKQQFQKPSLVPRNPWNGEIVMIDMLLRC